MKRQFPLFGKRSVIIHMSNRTLLKSTDKNGYPSENNKEI